MMGIETSCDETSVAIVEDGRVCAQCVSSQIKQHQKYGGVVPELASRIHAETIHDIIHRTLAKANVSFSDLDACGVTVGPGLEGALMVGMTAARVLATCLSIPLIAVNHLHGHIYSAFIERDPPSFPFVALIVSGGHTLLVLVKDYFKIELLGATRDDACGEAFDKVARLLGLGYPGGPVIEKKAIHGNATQFHFPRAMINDGLSFSFSGIKTAVSQKVASLQS